MSFGRVWGVVSGALFEYETQKVVQINSKKIGAIFRLIQLGIVLYVIVWVMYYERGYQSFDFAVSGVTAKLKGIAFANLTNDSSIGSRVWDAADYVIPPQQNSAFFVTTNVVITPGQQQGTCEESHDVYLINCTSDIDCKRGELVMLGSGVKTGRCVNSTREEKMVCEIYGWCPTEYDVLPLKDQSLLSSAPNFTVMLKNSIEFPKYKVKRRNILSWMDKKFLYTCRYNPNHARNKFCPIFRLKDILAYAEADNKKIWIKGGMISIHIEWNCNLDYNEEFCVPKYTFRRLDDFNSPVAKGWNFRYSHHYVVDNVLKRTLIKAYGIQFFITVYGRGGKFDFLTFTMNLGSGLALLGIASVLCDMIVLNITRKRRMYRLAKVDTVAYNDGAEPDASIDSDITGVPKIHRHCLNDSEDDDENYCEINGGDTGGFRYHCRAEEDDDDTDENVLEAASANDNNFPPSSLTVVPPAMLRLAPNKMFGGKIVAGNGGQNYCPPLAERDSLSRMSSNSTLSPPTPPNSVFCEPFNPAIFDQLKAIDDSSVV